MNTLRDHDAAISAWLDDGPQTLPAETRQTIAVGIRTGTQRRSRIAWPFVGRGLPTPTPRRLILALPAAAVLVASAAVGLTLYAGPLSDGTATLPTTPAAWTRSQVELPHLHTITEGGPGLVAVGGHTAEDDYPSTTSDDLADIWTSSDGLTWDPVAQELGRGTIYDVTSGGPGLVAVGYVGTLQGMVWTSQDGLTWNRVPEDPDLSRRIHAVSVGGPGLVAVGFQNRAWFSSDGLDWDLASVPPVPPDVYLGDSGAEPQVYLDDVAAAGDRLVAVGSSMLKDESYRAVLWTSGDGTAWTDVPLDPDVFPRGSSISTVTGGPTGFVAIGEAGRGGQAAMWTSADGVSWHRVGSDQEPFVSSRSDGDASRVTLNSVVAGSAGFVAVGGDGPCAKVQRCASVEAAVWTSPDGKTWIRVATGPEFRPDGLGDPNRGTSAQRVVRWGSRFLVWGEYDGDKAIWISEPLAE